MKNKEEFVSLKELFRGAIIFCSGFLLMILISPDYQAKLCLTVAIVAIAIYLFTAMHFAKEIDKL